MTSKSNGTDSAVVTRLLNQAAAGDAHASEELLPLVYQELRRLASSKMRRERSDQTLQATALVHEAYLRLVGDGVAKWDDRWHFFAAAAEAMRRIIVDNARRRASIKRGGGRERSDIDAVEITIDVPTDDLLALDEALEQLAQRHPDKAQLVKLRFFAGLTIDEASQAMNISTATAERHWSFARAWLYRQMSAS
jgi:RNA polymerase sigma factor (TIGR02999 family)